MRVFALEHARLTQSAVNSSFSLFFLSFTDENGIKNDDQRHFTRVGPGFWRGRTTLNKTGSNTSNVHRSVPTAGAKREKKIRVASHS